MFDLSVEIPMLVWASWLALPFNYLLVRNTNEIGLWVILCIQMLVTPMFTLGYLTHGNLWISLGIPNLFFFIWLIWICKRDYLRGSSGKSK
jgi:hypothetical protein